MLFHNYQTKYKNSIHVMAPHYFRTHEKNRFCHEHILFKNMQKCLKIRHFTHAQSMRNRPYQIHEIKPNIIFPTNQGGREGGAKSSKIFFWRKFL